jgi:mRNA interferase MazF
MVGSAFTPNAGDIIKVNLSPHAGHEQGGWRPALVLSPAIYNAKTGLAVVMPVTTQVKGYPFEVRLVDGMQTTGVILVDAIRNLDLRARRARFVEVAPLEVVTAATHRLALLLGLSK